MRKDTYRIGDGTFAFSPAVFDSLLGGMHALLYGMLLPGHIFIAHLLMTYCRTDHGPKHPVSDKG